MQFDDFLKYKFLYKPEMNTVISRVSLIILERTIYNLQFFDVFFPLPFSTHLPLLFLFLFSVTIDDCVQKIQYSRLLENRLSLEAPITAICKGDFHEIKFD